MTSSPQASMSSWMVCRASSAKLVTRSRKRSSIFNPQKLRTRTRPFDKFRAALQRAQDEEVPQGVTFCLAIKVSDGVVGIADTRVISGSENITARKVAVFEQDGGSFFLMTSGLRSVRDKVMTYFGERVSEQEDPFDRLFKVANAFAEDVRRVSREDREALEESGLRF